MKKNLFILLSILVLSSCGEVISSNGNISSSDNSFSSSTTTSNTTSSNSTNSKIVLQVLVRQVARQAILTPQVVLVHQVVHRLQVKLAQVNCTKQLSKIEFQKDIMILVKD